METQGTEADLALFAAAQQAMQGSGVMPDHFFHAHRGGRAEKGSDFAEALAGRKAACDADAERWRGDHPVTNHIDEVEQLWAAIAERDDWKPLNAHVARIRALGAALGPAPVPAGHV